MSNWATCNNRRRDMKRLLAALLFCLLPSLAQAASCTSYPFTLQNNTTADATQVMANFNTVRNCVVNNAAGSGVNTDITALLGLTTPLAPSEGGSSVFIGGTSSGSGNAQSVASTTPTGFSLTSGYRVTFTAGATNTGATTLNVNGQGATTVNRVGHAGLEALTGGEMVAGNIIEAIYNGSVFVLLSTDLSGVGQAVSIAGAATTDLGTVPTHNALITGSGATITSFGSSAAATDPIYLIAFSGVQTLTYNATSLLIPGQGNITTAANDTAVVEYLGSGNWQVLSYTRASGAPIVAILPIPAAFKNLSVKVATNTTVAVSADFVTLYDGNNTVTLPVSCTIDLGSSGAVNKLDTGTIATNSWYAIWPIYNGVTVGCIGSLSSTAPTMPAGYTFKARVGWVQTINASATLYGTWQFGRQAQYVVGLAQTANYPIIQPSGAVGTAAAGGMVSQALTRFVPTTASRFYGGISQSSAGSNSAGVGPNNSLGASTSLTNPIPFNIVGIAAQPSSIPINMLLESYAVFYFATSTGFSLYTTGWEDNI